MNIKSQSGSVTLYVITAMVIFSVVAVGFFIASTNKQQIQLEAIEQMRDVYANGAQTNQIYKQYIGGDIIPIYTEEQLIAIVQTLSADRTQDMYINGKTYTINSNKTYTLQNDIRVSQDISAIQTLIDNRTMILEKQGYEIILPTTIDGQMLSTIMDNIESGTDRISNYYGLKVDYDYPIKAINETDEILGNEYEWQIYYMDGEKIYLTTKDYINYKDWAKPTNETILLPGDSDYNGRLDSLSTTYTGDLSAVKDNRIKALLSYGAKLNQVNMKSVEYLLDNKKWGVNFAGDKALYAIGGPTLDLFARSYKVTHQEQEELEYTKASYDGTTERKGYAIRRKEAGESYREKITNYASSDFYNLYTISTTLDLENSTGKANFQWIASPGIYEDNENNDTCVMYIAYNGTINSATPNVNGGIRPIVCLKEGVSLAWDSTSSSYLFE